jgi:membrane-bound lytic murein transglycosylase B
VRRWVIVSLVAALSVTAAGPAAASPRDPGPTSAAQARAEALAAAAKIAELTTEYTRRQRAAADAAAALAAAFTVGSQAEADRDQIENQLRRSRARQVAQVRALYVEGTDGLVLAMLGADSVQDALWRATVGPRVGTTVVRDAGTDVERTRAATEEAADRSVAADEAGSRLATALGRLQEESASADTVLAEARRRVAALSATARRLQEAEDAAAALAAAERAAAARRLGASGPITALGIPAAYQRAYQQAAGSCPGLRWTLLAAVGQVESGHGRNSGPSSAGAVGPMQFMPATFARYGIDGDHDGKADAWNYADAIPTAARYLCASGLDATPAGVQQALLAYNHAQWYVDLVLSTERAIVATVARSGPETVELTPAPPAA